MSEGYDVQAVEAKWQQVWEERGTYQIDESDPRPKFYDLCMYPYPSGPIHMGHVRNYTLGDVLCRYKTMQGFGVLSPDGVGLVRPAGGERRHRRGRPPRDHHPAADRHHEGPDQAARLGLRLAPGAVVLRARLLPVDAVALRPAPQGGPGLQADGAGQLVPVAVRPSWPTSRPRAACATGAATEVVKRDLEQWMFRITDYAEQLLDDLDTVDWPERVKTMQRNWIGRSEGVEFDIAVRDSDTRSGSSPPAPTRSSA